MRVTSRPNIGNCRMEIDKCKKIETYAKKGVAKRAATSLKM